MNDTKGAFMGYQHLIGKTCLYRPLYQAKLVEAVITDVVAYGRLDGTTTEYAVFENGDQMAVSALLFRF